MLIVKFHKNEFLLFRIGQNLGLGRNNPSFCWITIYYFGNISNILVLVLEFHPKVQRDV